MRRSGGLAILTGATLMLAADASWAASPPPNGGTVFVTALNTQDGDRTSTQLAVNAATRALGAKGFTFLADPDHAAYLADVVVSRAEVGTGQEKVHAGAALMMGTGVSVPFATGQTRLVPLERTEVEISIRKRGETAALWHGVAVTVRSAQSREGAADYVAAVLSAAALRIYPRQPTEAVGVP